MVKPMPRTRFLLFALVVVSAAGLCLLDEGEPYEMPHPESASFPESQPQPQPEEYEATQTPIKVIQ